MAYVTIDLYDTHDEFITSVDLEHNEYDFVQRIAEEDGVSFDEAFRNAIRKGLDRVSEVHEYNDS